MSCPEVHSVWIGDEPANQQASTSLQDAKTAFLNQHPGSFYIGLRAGDPEYEALQRDSTLLTGLDTREQLFLDVLPEEVACLENGRNLPPSLLREVGRTREMLGRGNPLPFSMLQFQCGLANCEGTRLTRPLPTLSSDPTITRAAGMTDY